MSGRGHIPGYGFADSIVAKASSVNLKMSILAIQILEIRDAWVYSVHECMTMHRERMV